MCRIESFHCGFCLRPHNDRIKKCRKVTKHQDVIVTTCPEKKKVEMGSSSKGGLCERCKNQGVRKIPISSSSDDVFKLAPHDDHGPDSTSSGVVKLTEDEKQNLKNLLLRSQADHERYQSLVAEVKKRRDAGERTERELSEERRRQQKSN